MAEFLLIFLSKSKNKLILFGVIECAVG